MTEGPARLDPDLSARLAHLSVQAKVAAEGALTGIHRSARRGASVVFVEHREYRPGDDPRLLDWRAFARTDRPTLKRFEQEAQLTATLLLDRSASMDFRGKDDRPTKRDFAATLLGGLALILLRQGDRVSAIRFADGVLGTTPHRSGTAHLEPLLGAMLETASGDRTSLARSLVEAEPHLGRRSFVAIASDLIDDEGSLEALSVFAHRGHDVYVFHVLDPAEVSLDIDGAHRVHGLEGEPSVEVPADSVKQSYDLAIADFLRRVESTCGAMGIHYIFAKTDEEPALVLSRALGRGRPPPRLKGANVGLRAT